MTYTDTSTHLCPGSLQEPRYPDARGGYVKCRYCPSWVPAPKSFDDDGYSIRTAEYVPDHESPITHEQVRVAANIIRYEYEQARKNGTLHQPPSYRWHSYALDIAVPSHVFGIVGDEL